jgi:hypothetical protein
LPPVKDKRSAGAPTSVTSPHQPSVSDAPSTQTSDSPSSSTLLPGRGPSTLIRETNRLTLRAYLNTLMSSSPLASSPVMRSFLTSGQIKLTPEELDDASRREEADQNREEGRKRFAREIASRIEGLRTAVKSVKGDVMGKGMHDFYSGLPFLSIALLGGLTQLFAIVKTTPSALDLPSNYRAVLEWARISSVASPHFGMHLAIDYSSYFLV